jgi:hypothetical protein
MIKGNRPKLPAMPTASPPPPRGISLTTDTVRKAFVNYQKWCNFLQECDKRGLISKFITIPKTSEVTNEFCREAVGFIQRGE